MISRQCIDKVQTEEGELGAGIREIVQTEAGGALLSCSEGGRMMGGLMRDGERNATVWKADSCTTGAVTR